MASQALIPEPYEGREQAYVKHHVLEKYLEKLVAILGVSNSTLEFTYIDCFAGPWGDDSQDMSSTSIAISLQVLARFKQTAESRGAKAVIRALYVENNDLAFLRLKEYLFQRTPVGITTCALHGEFVASRNSILSWVGNSGYAFFFIDPKGYTEVGVRTLRPLLERPRSEFVINFMFDFINRVMSMKAHADAMAELVGEAVDLTNLTETNREMEILNTYRKNLKASVHTNNSKYPARSAYISILDPRKDRTKYHLVYLTTHHKGIIKFLETCEISTELQGLVRAKIRDDKKEAQTGTGDLFADDAPFVSEEKSKIDPTNIDRYWLEFIGSGRSVTEAQFSDILEKTNWFPGELQESLARLIYQKKVVNLDASKSRPKNPLHFAPINGERLQPLPRS